MTTLAEAVAVASAALADAHRNALVEALRGAGTYSAALANKATAAVPAPHRPAVEELTSTWSECDGATGEALALALDASAAARRVADSASVQVAVTGPNTPFAPVRLTAAVVQQLIDDAQQRITLVSFAAYSVTRVIEALDRAVGRGVKVALILESPENLDGGGGADAYARYERYCWPLNTRQPSTAKLHAKAVIVDSNAVLLTSANMTNAAFESNIELGVVCRGGDVARRVQQHFDGLIQQGILSRTG